MDDLKIIHGLNEFDYGYAVVNSAGEVIGFNFDTYADAEAYMIEFLKNVNE